MARLGVNIDHIATLREARRGLEPEPVSAALICEKSGADSIVVHLREDRRHIKESDLYLLRKRLKIKLNLEMSTYEDIVKIALRVKPDRVTLVPEKRQELTTEGGLNAFGHFKRIERVVVRLDKARIGVSLFIDPVKKQIDAAKSLNVKMVELHTGRYANAKNKAAQKKYLFEIGRAVGYARARGLKVFAGHGLDYMNTARIAKIKGIEEFNIGYSIICRAVWVGLSSAVREMKVLLN